MVVPRLLSKPSIGGFQISSLSVSWSSGVPSAARISFRGPPIDDLGRHGDRERLCRIRRIVKGAEFRYRLAERRPAAPPKKERSIEKTRRGSPAVASGAGNDDVERSTHGFGGGEAKDALSADDCKADQARPIGADDGVGCVPNQAIAKKAELGGTENLEQHDRVIVRFIARAEQ
jgi:hypothetical protein